MNLLPPRTLHTLRGDATLSGALWYDCTMSVGSNSRRDSHFCPAFELFLPLMRLPLRYLACCTPGHPSCDPRYVIWRKPLRYLAQTATLFGANLCRRIGL